MPAGSRDRLERLCRYALRPALGQDRLQLTADGKAVLELRRRWTDGTTHLVLGPDDPSPPRRPNRPWAELMQRGFGFDVLACPRCPGRLRLVVLIQDGAVIQRILRHLGLPTVVPEMQRSRAPPLPFEVDDDGVSGDDE